MEESSNPLVHRLGLDWLDYKVPAYSNALPYMLGGITLFGFIIMAITGIYLALFYIPETPAAYQTVVNIVTGVPFGDFARSLHFWTANLMILTIALHLARTFFYGSYKRPRELTWLTGVGLLAVIFSFIFLGTVLRWDQEGVEAFGHLQEMAELLGIQISTTTFGVSILAQFFVMHTMILSVLFLLLLSVHVLLIKRYGISPYPYKEAKIAVTAGKGSSHFLAHMRRLSGFGLLFFFLSGTLALAFPAPLGSQGVAGAEVTKPLWMFYPLYAVENFFGVSGMLWSLILFFSLLAVIPFIDRSPYVSWEKRKPIVFLGVLVLIVIIGLGAYTALTGTVSHLMADKNATSAVGSMNESMNASAAPLNLSRAYTQQETPIIAIVLLIALALGIYLARK